MKSRYDFMVDGNVIDNDGIPFPDPLLDYNKGSLQKIPSLYTITEQDLRKFWTCMWENYQLNHYDDLWLNINGIPYLMELRPGDQIYKVDISDLTDYLKRPILGS